MDAIAIKEKKDEALALLCPSVCHMDEEGAWRWHWPSNRYFSPLTDLNAIGEAEKSCEDTERYYCTLATIVSGKTCYKVSEAHHEKVFVATAAQRAEAVLRYHEQKSTG